ncbi:uncharacterized protein PGRI_003010 [Penicillium griseofulvum]|uniref:F-box domain-containing protein n=1 Tax=Penicillium patulum TaxID=5078 RepID=A0A135LWG1_PENPA|nr:uncharacterized protein PGRI_003010 [Penicillium griseofulvum]KXG53251.1 hypothetical protein PGRI_003010 [Penicillium griseofulvum]
MLSKLPVELLLSIASYLDNHTDTLRFASSCRAFYQLLLPGVFTSLDLTECRNGQLSHLVHTLASRPELAQEVRTLSVSHGWRPPAGVRYEQEVILPILNPVLECWDSLSNWDWELQTEGNNDAWTVLLLTLLPNLEDLFLEIHDFSNYTLEWMSRVGYRLNPGLSKLKHFTAVCSDVDGGHSSIQFTAILQFPSLRTFSGHWVCDEEDPDEEDFEDEEGHDVASYVPDSSNVTHIHLKSSCSRKGFWNMIGAAKRLESFVLEHAGNPTYADDEGVHASSYYQPLQKHRETLQTLTLTDKRTNNYTAHQIVDYDYVGSFAGFSALKELRMQICHILDWDGDLDMPLNNGFSDVLPLSLESLTLDGLEEYQTPHLAEAFKDFFSGGRCRCPNLTYLEVKGNWMHVQQSTEESNAKPRPIPAMLKAFAAFKVKLEVLCSAAGVEFRLRDLHVEDIIQQNALYDFESDAL